MVFLTAINFVRVKNGGNRFWKRKRIFQLAANFYGRRRNCYTIAIRSVEKALTHVAEGRQVKKRELGFNYGSLRHNLTKCSIALDRRILSDLAYSEPRTFKSLVNIARAKRHLEPPNEKAALEAPPEGVFTRGHVVAMWCQSGLFHTRLTLTWNGELTEYTAPCLPSQGSA
uniref:Putative ribosomal protein l20 n=1 Tax=Ixodes ricinus TaxID=34613 RepID=A0A090X9Q2_IXORI